MFDFLFNHTPLHYLTQSMWRDEAFSVLTAQGSLASFIGTLNFEPPVYYVLLHFWIQIFGTSEIAVRSLSLLLFFMATCVVVFWSEKVFQKHWLAYATPLFFFFNPMLLYYAFETRAYGALMLWSTLSLYAYTTKRYRLLTIANTLAFYTHSFALFIPFTQAVHFLFTHTDKRQLLNIKFLLQHPLIQSLIGWFLLIAPWIVVLLQELLKSRSGWYYPVDLQLVYSVLGNMFTSYDGTPGQHWIYTRILSVFLLLLFVMGLRRKEYRHQTSYLFFTIFVPLIIVIGVSFFKPMFVNRYLIYVTIAQVMLSSYAIFQFKKSSIQIVLGIIFVLLLTGINTYLPSRKAKLDIRSVIAEANTIRQKQDLLYVTSPLIFFEAQYYTKDREHVFLYNPEGYAFPWYVGESAFNPKQTTAHMPFYPQRAVVVNEDGTIRIHYQTYPNGPTPDSTELIQ